MGPFEAISGNFGNFWRFGGAKPGNNKVLIDKNKAEDCTPKRKDVFQCLKFVPSPEKLLSLPGVLGRKF